MKFKYRDKLVRAEFLSKLFGVLFSCSLILCITMAGFQYKLYADFKDIYEAKIEQTIIKLIPIPGPGPIDIDLGDSKITSSYINAIAKRVVELHENWNWTNIRERYNEILQIHASVKYENFLKANMEAVGFIEKVEARKMMSTFSIQKEKSKSAYCEKLRVTCAVVSGKRVTFTDFNKPLDEEDVSYLILSSVVMPTSEDPNPLRIERLIILDNVSNPHDRAMKLLADALDGKLPEN